MNTLGSIIALHPGALFHVRGILPLKHTMSDDLTILRKRSLTELVELALSLGLDNAGGMRKQDLVFEIIQRQPAANVTVGRGVLEILADGFGFLRSAYANFVPGGDDIYVSPSQIRRFNLRTGDEVSGRVRAPKEGERYFALIKIETINERAPDEERRKMLFDNLGAMLPDRRLILEGDPAVNVLNQYVPLAHGQRVLVMSDERGDRLGLLASMARALMAEHTVILLLVDERPEQIAALRDDLDVNVISSSLEETPARHVQVAQMAVERAKRLVEQGRDVVLLVESLTRLARAIQTTNGRQSPDPQTVYDMRRFFSVGRQLEEGGSLTVVATAVIDANTGCEALVDDLRSAANVEVRLCASDQRTTGVPGVDLASGYIRSPSAYLSADELTQWSSLQDSIVDQDPMAVFSAACVENGSG